MDGELGAFLRSRRARIQPEEVGLTSHGRRRVPGLRREEVAQLAGVSVDYYIRLEQGRGQSVSAAVLDAIARVLRLDETEHAYLHAVARPANRPGRKAAPRVRPGIRLLLDSMDRSPAAVVGPRLDILAWNALYDALFGYSRVAPRARSVARHVFLDPASRDLYPDWAAMAAECVAHLRRVSGHRREDRQLAELVGELSVKSEDFRHLWADHQVKECMFGVKRLRHPVAGQLTLQYETLTVHPADPEQTLVIYASEPGSETAERLALLGSWASTGT